MSPAGPECWQLSAPATPAARVCRHELLGIAVCLQEELHQAQGGTDDEAEGLDASDAEYEDCDEDEEEEAQEDMLRVG